MYRTTSVLAIVLFGSSMVAMAGDSDAQRMREEIVTKADSLFKEHYAPRADKPLRTFDKDRESRPADTVIYWFNTNYVVRLVFATDGSLVRVELFPEALLYSDSWTSVPDTVELGPGEMRWFIALASQLRTMGDPVSLHNLPNACFYSGQNVYCRNSYELAEVRTYRREDYRLQPPQISLREVTIGHKQPVIGVVSELKAVSGNEHQFMVGPLWYRIYRAFDQSLFDTLTVGSVVNLTAFGCAGNELACDVFPALATPPKR
jgi:hypothetical protein